MNSHGSTERETEMPGLLQKLQKDQLTGHSHSADGPIGVYTRLREYCPLNACIVVEAESHNLASLS